MINYPAKLKFALPLTSAVVLLQLSASNACDILAAVRTERYYEWGDKLAYWSIGSRGWNILSYTILEISHERNQRVHENVLKVAWESTKKTKHDNTAGALNNIIWVTSKVSYVVSWM